MIDNLERVDDVLSGGCHALIKGSNERYWITPHRASFHEWTWEFFVGQRYTARAFWHASLGRLPPIKLDKGDAA
jgi:hypothetical protein